MTNLSRQFNFRFTRTSSILFFFFFFILHLFLTTTILKLRYYLYSKSKEMVFVCIDFFCRYEPFWFFVVLCRKITFPQLVRNFTIFIYGNFDWFPVRNEIFNWMDIGQCNGNVNQDVFIVFEYLLTHFLEGNYDQQINAVLSNCQEK